MTGSARYSVGLEQGADGALIAHGLTLPGCVGAGSTPEAALCSFQDALIRWLRFLGSVGEPLPPQDAELEIAVDEWLQTDAAVGEGESTACFEADLAELKAEEIARGLRLLGDLRGSLLARIRRLRDVDLEVAAGGWTVRHILDELARGQWWTLSRLGASPMAEVPETVVGRLDTAMALVVQHFGHMGVEQRGARLELDGEEWTPRKVLRRLLWLEWELGQAALSTLAASR